MIIMVMIMIIRRPFSGRACENNFRLLMYQFSGQGDWESEGKGSCRARIIPNMVARSLQIVTSVFRVWGCPAGLTPSFWGQKSKRYRFFRMYENVSKTARAKTTCFDYFGIFWPLRREFETVFGAKLRPWGSVFGDCLDKSCSLNFGVICSRVF